MYYCVICLVYKSPALSFTTSSVCANINLRPSRFVDLLQQPEDARSGRPQHSRPAAALRPGVTECSQSHSAPAGGGRAAERGRRMLCDDRHGDQRLKWRPGEAAVVHFVSGGSARGIAEAVPHRQHAAARPAAAHGRTAHQQG